VVAGTLLFELDLERRPAPGETLGTIRWQDLAQEIVATDALGSWDAASPGFRLTSLAAQLGRLLARRDRGAGPELDELVVRSRALAEELGEDASAIELANVVEQVAELVRTGAGR
ncbi:MAG: hypothetical protein AAF560_34030, partial [Acidobacteriota bacterium]